MGTRVGRAVAAVVVLGAGATHLVLWLAGYGDQPEVRALSLVDVAGGVAMAAALLTRPKPSYAVAALAFAVAALAGFLLAWTPRLVGVDGASVETGGLVAVLARVATVAVAALWFRATHPAVPVGYSEPSRSSSGTRIR
jgi:hypothetical protein